MPTRYPEVAEHSVYFFFPFHFKVEEAFTHTQNLAAAKILSLRDVPWLPAAFRGREAADKAWESLVWKMDDPGTMFSPDLHPHLRQILAGRTPEKAGGDSAIFTGHAPFSLSPEMLNLLSGACGKKGKGMSLCLSQSAQRRLGVEKESPVAVLLKGATVYLLGTGIGVLALELEYAAAEKQKLPFVIIEANNALAHAVKKKTERLHWQDACGSEAAPGDAGAGAGQGFFLADLVKALLPGMVAANNHDSAWQRLFTYTTISFQNRIFDSRLRSELVTRLSKRYTADYVLSATIGGGDQVSPFENITHGAAIEGGCVVVEQSADLEVDFLKTYLKNSVKKVYLPIALISFHEFLKLMQLTQESGFFLNVAQAAEDLHKLEWLRNQVLQFRLYYRFSHASLISQHNLVHQMWRNVYSLEKILAELSQDVAEAEMFIAADEAKCQRKMATEAERLEQERLAAEIQREKKKEKRWKVFGSLGTGFGVFILSREITEAIITVYHNSLAWQLHLFFKDQTIPKSLFRTAEQIEGIELYGVLAGSGFALAAVLFAYFWKPK